MKEILVIDLNVVSSRSSASVGSTTHSVLIGATRLELCYATMLRDSLLVGDVLQEFAGHPLRCVLAVLLDSGHQVLLLGGNRALVCLPWPIGRVALRTQDQWNNRLWRIIARSSSGSGVLLVPDFIVQVRPHQITQLAGTGNPRLNNQMRSR